MGGEGSGRHPDPVNLFKRTNNPDEDAGRMYLPNYSGIKEGAKKTSTLSIATEYDPIFIATSGAFLKTETDPVWLAQSGSYLAIADNPWIESGANIFYSGGNVGINIEEPEAELDVSGMVYMGHAGRTPLTGTYAGRAVVNYGAGSCYFVGRDTVNNIEYCMGTSDARKDAFIGSISNHDLDFRTNIVTRMVIGSGGNIWVLKNLSGCNMISGVTIKGNIISGGAIWGNTFSGAVVSGAAVYVGSNAVLTAETDPVFLRESGAFLTAYTETDPIWLSQSGSFIKTESDPVWLAQSGGYVLTGEVSNYEEDPIWISQSGAFLKTETDPRFLALSGGFLTTGHNTLVSGATIKGAIISGGALWGSTISGAATKTNTFSGGSVWGATFSGATISGAGIHCSGTLSGGTTLQIFTGDHGYSGAPQVVSVIYNTSAGFPAANTTPEGTLAITYTA